MPGDENTGTLLGGAGEGGASASSDAPLSDAVDFFGEEASKEEKPKEEAPKAAKAKEDSKADSKQGDAPADEEEDEDSEGEGSESEDDEEEDAEESGEPKAQRRKPVVIKTSRKEVKMPPSAKVAVTVGGKEELVSLEEITQSYTSRSENKRRNNELLARERMLKADKDSETEKLKGLMERATKPQEAMTVLGEIIEHVGGDPLTVIKTLRSTIVDNVAAMLGATEAQVKALKSQLAYFETVEEANYYKDKLEKHKASQKKVADREQVVQRVKEVMREFNIPDNETFGETFEQLRQLKAEGKLKIEDITPTDVGGFFMIESLLTAEFPDLAENAESKVKLFRIAREMNPTKEELRKVVRQWLSSGAPAEAAEEAEEKPKLSSKPKAQKQTGTKPNKLADLFL